MKEEVNRFGKMTLVMSRMQYSTPLRAAGQASPGFECPFPTPDWEPGAYSSNLLKTSEALVPPNPNEFDMAYWMDIRRAPSAT